MAKRDEIAPPGTVVEHKFHGKWRVISLEERNRLHPKLPKATDSEQIVWVHRPQARAAASLFVSHLMSPHLSGWRVISRPGISETMANPEDICPKCSSNNVGWVMAALRCESCWHTW